MRKLAIVGGLVVAAILAGTLYVINFWGNTEASLVLDDTSGPCTIVTPVAEKDVAVRRKKKITWTITNNCATPQTVMVGNFRTVMASSATTCTSGTAGGEAWPFKRQDEDEKERSVTVKVDDTGDISLKDAKDTKVDLTYYFDICVGGTKVDPRLVIEAV